MNAAAPKPPRERPEPPAHLSPIALEMWERLVELTDGMGILTSLDCFALEQRTEACAAWRQAVEILDAEGTHYVSESKAGGTMIRPHPAEGMRSDAARRFQSLMSELGLTPANRSRVSAAGEGAADDPADKYFQGGAG